MIAAVAIATITGATYAALSLTVQMTGTIVVGNPNLFLLTGMTSTTTCSASSGTYTDTGLAIAWGNMAQGQSYDQYACIYNSGVDHTLSVSSGWNPVNGAFSYTINGANANGYSLSNQGYALIDLHIQIAINAATGTIPPSTMVLSIS